MQLVCRGPSSRRPKQRCAAGKSQPSEIGDSNSDQDPQPSQLDWRKFRAGLVAAERRQASDPKEESQTAAESQLRDSEGESASTDTAVEENSRDEIWAHQISAPETGCLLFARRAVVNMVFFEDSCIMITQHGELSG